MIQAQKLIIFPKTSKHWAEVRGAQAARIWRGVGVVSFGTTATVSGYDIYDAYTNDDSNKNEVYLKSGLNITMGLVAFILGFGWAVSGTYFILDASGAFGTLDKLDE